MKNYKGFSLVELLVVITILAVVFTLTTRSIFLIIRGSKKSDTMVKVRENLDSTISTLERQLRFAQSISSPSGPVSTLDYIDGDGNTVNFKCSDDANGNGFISSTLTTTRLSSDMVDITNCSDVFTVIKGTSGIPDSVIIKLTGEDATIKGAEGSRVTISTTVNLRSY